MTLVIQGEQTDKTLEERIDRQYKKLSPSQKKAAEWMRRNLQQTALSTAKKVGEEALVSEATVHRLVHVLGYKGFQDMKSHLQESFITDRTVLRFEYANETTNDLSWIQQAVQLECVNLRGSFTSELEEAIQQAATCIINSKKRYVVGWRAGLSVSTSLSYLLNLILGDTQLLPAGGELSEKLAYITEEDLIIAVGFPRYCKVTWQAVEQAKENGATSIVFTDTPISPFYPIADVALLANTQSIGFFDSYVTPLLVSQLLIQEIGRQAPEQVKSNLKKQEELFRKWCVI
ncbi:MurR/RpiR family transcriptional regulator [Alkalihalobacterium chitinilyticum]|uniref:MurR/RpiR family transcriptional regulator n=1 Tax=Alkalihalobacterium chitinilyticum TaxID=2980103 RepID=A0ABT5VLF4_9BACI|nr:MurR/RpiR family transcriptional regulator [Alkalihalobacterium chitinilyticum]MDE5416273.1 MurR/RpiR family transcriptional regulator [Alkalihalobacterium chitinilyticum]